MKMLSCAFILHILLSTHVFSSKQSIEQLFNTESYNKRVIPQAVNVTTQLFVSSIGPVNDKHNTYELNYFHRQWWSDPRIAYNKSFGDITLSSDISEYVWVPDITFVNAKSISTIHHASRTIIRPNGDIYVVKRYQSTATCMLDLSNYPFDTQICPMQLESFAYPIDKLNNNWSPGGAVYLNKDVGKPLAGYDLVSTSSYRSIHSYLVGNESVPFPNLFVEFKIRRALMYYIFQSFIPIILLMMLNFGSYWVPDSAIPARVTLIVTTFLASTLILQTATEMTVKLSHLTPMQIFLIVNVSFIVVSLMQYLTVLSLKTWDRIQLSSFRKSLSSQKDTIPNGHCKQFQQKVGYLENDSLDSRQYGQSRTEFYRERYLATKLQKCTVELTHPLDRVCRLIIPSLYLLFIISYWLYYKHHKADNS